MVNNMSRQRLVNVLWNGEWRMEENQYHNMALELDYNTRNKFRHSNLRSFNKLAVSFDLQVGGA